MELVLWSLGGYSEPHSLTRQTYYKHRAVVSWKSTPDRHLKITNSEQLNVSKIKGISKVIIDFICYEQRKTAVSSDIVVQKKSHLKGS